ncbi:MAG TPA: hypothetical protein ENI79_01990 [Rhodospirillales bacterium]|nr:hypothetical protein [Rhodospirillales bacterium]
MDLFISPLPEAALPGPGALVTPGEPVYSVFERPPIQETEALPGANMDTANFVFEKPQDGLKRPGDGGQENRQRVFSPANISFAALLEVAGSDEGAAEGARANGVANFSAKAAEAYETSARVVTGDNNPLGESLSLRL